MAAWLINAGCLYVLLWYNQLEGNQKKKHLSVSLSSQTGLKIICNINSLIYKRTLNCLSNQGKIVSFFFYFLILHDNDRFFNQQQSFLFMEGWRERGRERVKSHFLFINNARSYQISMIIKYAPPHITHLVEFFSFECNLWIANVILYQKQRI